MGDDRYFTTRTGYEKYKGSSKCGCCGQWMGATIGIHRIIAIADGADPYKVFSGGEYVVHHGSESDLPACELPWANWPGNLEVMTRSDHSSMHSMAMHASADG